MTRKPERHKEVWGILDPDGKIIAKFRYEVTAIEFCKTLSKQYFEKLDIIRIDLN